MHDLPDSTDRPARRTALVAQELSRYGVDIAAVSETRLADDGSLTEIERGYTFFSKYLLNTERRLYGMGFAMRS